MCRTVYETECWTKHNVLEVEDEVAVCQTVEEKKCEDVVSGYTSSLQCSTFPREKCRLEKRKTKKVSPETGCDKEPVELCAPRGCGFVNVRNSSNLSNLRSDCADRVTGLTCLSYNVKTFYIKSQVSFCSYWTFPLIDLLIKISSRGSSLL